ncbi:hypothetical protein LTR70_007201 [Exophiala xenobiotica]|uniref:C4-dicarboxylate transporter/malic acid transport protein n=1 Tax=Lithohypha guttulata TaxID=1690604 RepID=A0ABR0K809_9EURO|nr:hypothetical protein LTR24_006070 [Lithohypha guttulata]KAK5314305.1 hypothetical protein LTR70_007201 [Exophiala xenobiotica]
MSTTSDSTDTEAEASNQDGNLDTGERNVRMLDRLKHFTWAWFTLPMSTGGIALLLSPQLQPHTFPGLNTIGKVVYIFDLVNFTTLVCVKSYRFLRWRNIFIGSLTHPTESLMAATSLSSLASIIAAIARYGIPACGPWLVVAYRVLFWIYFAVTFIYAVGQYTLLFTSPLLKIEDMTPAWDLPIFPFMLSGTIAATGSQTQPPEQAVPMLVAGLTAQGLGFIVSILMYAAYIQRSVQFGFPDPSVRPAMFIAVGPPSFTALALLGMANDWPRAYTNYFGDPIDYSFAGAGEAFSNAQQQLIGIEILRTMATMSAIFMWSLSLWLFCIAVIACLQVRRSMTFHLNWWAFVFPNTGFTIATISIGRALESQGVMWVGSIMTTGIICTWFFVAVCHVRAVWKHDILWEGKDEDMYAQVGQPKKEKSEKVRQAQKGNGDVEDVEKQD